MGRLGRKLTLYLFLSILRKPRGTAPCPFLQTHGLHVLRGPARLGAHFSDGRIMSPHHQPRWPRLGAVRRPGPCALQTWGGRQAHCLRQPGRGRVSPPLSHPGWPEGLGPVPAGAEPLEPRTTPDTRRPALYRAASPGKFQASAPESVCEGRPGSGGVRTEHSWGPGQRPGSPHPPLLVHRLSAKTIPERVCGRASW